MVHAILGARPQAKEYVRCSDSQGRMHLIDTL